MHFFFKIFLFSFPLFLFFHQGESQEEPVIHLEGNVKIETHDGHKLSGERAFYQGEKIIFEENIKFTEKGGDIIHLGEKAIFDREKRSVHFFEAISSLPNQLLFKNEEVFYSEEENSYLIPNAEIFFEDISGNPPFKIKVRSLEIQDERIFAKNPILTYKNIPLFPFFSLTGTINGGISLPKVGYSSHLGFYWRDITSQISHSENEEREKWWTTDIFTKRGIGLGWNFQEHNKVQNKNIALEFYYLYDTNFEKGNGESKRRYIDENRYHISFNHLTEGEDWESVLLLNIFSDDYFLRDFQEEKFKKNPFLENFWILSHQKSAFFSSFFTRFNANSFQSQTTALPEIRIEMSENQINQSPFNHSFSFSLGNYEYRNRGEEDLEQNRFRGVYQVSLPQRYKSFSFIPKVGQGYQGYHNLSKGEDFDTSFIFTEIDAGFKLYNFYETLNKTRRLGIPEGTLHTLEFYTSFFQIHFSKIRKDFVGIQRNTSSSEARNLNYLTRQEEDFIKQEKIARFGVKNFFSILSGREEKIWLSANTYFDRIFSANSEERFSPLYNEISWTPLPWMRSDLSASFPVFEESSNTKQVFANLEMMVHPQINLSLFYQMNDNVEQIEDRNSLGLNMHIAINELYAFGIIQNWDVEKNKLDYQKYILHKNTDNWTTSFGIYHRERRDEKSEFGISLDFSLSSFSK